MSDAGWAEAVDGCRYVLHVASPFPPEQPKDPQELIVPARDGAVRVLRAESLASEIPRLTSSGSSRRSVPPPRSTGRARRSSSMSLSTSESRACRR